jgi:hypothetical protein
MTFNANIHLILALLGAGSTLGQITYVDAREGSDGNTFLTGGSLANTDWIDSKSNSASINNSLWSKRFGGTPGWTQHNGGDVIQGMVTAADTDTLGELTTRITGLADGNYDVWVFFWEQIISETQNWVIDAGLTSGSLVSYSSSLGPVDGSDSTSPVNADTLTFTSEISVVGVDGRQNMFGVNLGQVLVENGSNIEVYIDKLFGNGSNNRTIYDGVGYELVEPTQSRPEISSLTLVGDDTWQVQLSGKGDTAYRIRSSSTLEFESGTIIEGLSQTRPEDAGEVGGESDDLVITDASGRATILVPLTEGRDFIRTELAP